MRPEKKELQLRGFEYHGGKHIVLWKRDWISGIPMWSSYVCPTKAWALRSFNLVRPEKNKSAVELMMKRMMYCRQILHASGGNPLTTRGVDIKAFVLFEEG